MARPGLSTHRKFRRLVKSVGSVIVARGVLELLWDSCYESGNDYIGTAEDIENLVGWTGERGVLTLALVSCGLPEGHGFIEPVERRMRTRDTHERVSGVHDVSVNNVRYRIHDLWQHAPEYVLKRKKREDERQQRVTPRQRVRRTAPNGGQCLPDGVQCPPNGGTPVAVQSSTEQGSTEQRNDSAETVPVSAPAFLVFPTVGQAHEWTLTRSQVEAWGGIYPSLDVAQECRGALAWVQARPHKRKTARGMPAFLQSWLNRSNDNKASRPMRAVNGTEGRGRTGAAPPGKYAGIEES